MKNALANKMGRMSVSTRNTGYISSTDKYMLSHTTHSAQICFKN